MTDIDQLLFLDLETRSTVDLRKTGVYVYAAHPSFGAGVFLGANMSDNDNVTDLGLSDGRVEHWTFPDGTMVTMTVPAEEPPITAKHVVYCLSSIVNATLTELER